MSAADGAAPGLPGPAAGLACVAAAPHDSPADAACLVELAGELLGALPADGRLQGPNPAWTATLGWSTPELLAQPLADLIHEDDRPRFHAFVRGLGPVGTDTGVRARLRLRGGGYRWFEWTARAAGANVLLAARDVTDAVRGREALLRGRDELERRIAERTADLDRALARLHLHADNSPLATIEWDSGLRVTHWSRRACELFGWTEDEVLGRHPSQWPFLHPGDAAAMDAAMGRLFRREAPRNVHLNRVLTRDGRVLTCEWFDSALFDGGGEVESILSLVLDVTARTAAERELQRAHEELEARVAERTRDLERLMAALEDQARLDPLTGLPNRRGLLERLPRAIERSGRQRGGIAVMFIDLDRFKQVNDGLGHEAGDMVLRECAVRLVAAVRSTDIVARLGGDEFVVVLENVRDPHEHAPRVAEKIRHALAAPFTCAGRTIEVSASIGVVVHDDRPRSAEELIARADRGMYAAKRGGGNAVRVDTPVPARDPA